MSSGNFSSKESSVFERKLDCYRDECSRTTDDQISKIFQLEKCISWVSVNHYKKVCLQFPDKLLQDSTTVALFLQKKLNQTFYVLGDTSYGSCCVDEVAAEHINADAIIHFGHACLSPMTKLPVLYVFQPEDININQLKSEFQTSFSNDVPVIIFFDVMYDHLIQELEMCFEDNSNVTISSLQVNSTRSLKSDEKELYGRQFKFDENTNYSAVFIGPESITLINLALALPDFKWYFYYKDEINAFSFNRSRFMMCRSHFVEKIKEAHVIGILVGTLGIKRYLDAVERIKHLSKNKGKKCYILAVGRPNVAKLANFPEIDIFVYVSCSENSLSRDSKEFYKPIVSLFEVELALGGRPYSEQYIAGFQELLPGAAFFKQLGDKEEESTTDLVNKLSGAVIDYTGAQYLASRSWKGLPQNLENVKLEKASSGRSGVPCSYDNEKNTLR